MRFNQLLPSLKLLNGSFVVILPKGTSDVVVAERSVQDGSLCPTTKAFEGFRFAAACQASGMDRAGSFTSPGGGGLQGEVEGLGPALELSPKPSPRAAGWCRGHSEEDNTSREGL